MNSRTSSADVSTSSFARTPLGRASAFDRWRKTSSSTFSDSDGKVALAIGSARENIRLIQTWADQRDLEALKADTLVRYAIERAFIAIASSIKNISADLLAEHHIPAGMIAGFRNALAHTYDDILDERVILTIREDLPALNAALTTMEETLTR